MKFYLQTLKPDEFMQVNQCVTLSGIYTEPIDFTQEELDVNATLASLQEVMSEDQLIYLFGLNDTFRHLLEEAKRLQSVCSQARLIVPANEQGFMAVKASKRMNVPVAVGAIFQSEHAAIALQDQAPLLFVNLEKIGRYADSMQVLKDILALVDEDKKENVVAVCSSLEQVRAAMRAQAKAICANFRVYAQMMYGSAVQSDLSIAREEWLLTYARHDVVE